MIDTANKVDVVIGNLFESQAQTIVNTVNCVGVMGKGVALEFKKRYPAMFEDYVKRCERGEVRLGRPYLYRNPEPPHVLNFPTKGHWRSAARLKDIVEGLEYLEVHYREWGISSLAVPPLGCGQGGLDWHAVGPTLYERLGRLGIPVILYAPSDTPHAELTPRYLHTTLRSNRSNEDVPGRRRLQAGWLAPVAALAELESDPHHWPIGRTSFHKLAYFVTAAGAPTGLVFERGTYGPYAADLKRVISALVNNGLLAESQLGRMIQLKVGDTYPAVRAAYEDELAAWREPIQRAACLLARLRTHEAEVAATVHLLAIEALGATGEPPTDEVILTEAMRWKSGKRPPLSEEETLNAIHGLAMLGWLQVAHSERTPIDEAALVGL